MKEKKPNIKKMVKDEDVNGLSEALKLENEKIRGEAFQALTKMLSFSGVGIRAAEALRKAGRSTIKSLEVNIRSREKESVLGAIEELARLGKLGDIQAIKLLKDHSGYTTDYGVLERPTGNIFLDMVAGYEDAQPNIVTELMQIERSLIESLKIGGEEQQKNAALALGEIARYDLCCSGRWKDAFINMRDEVIKALESLSNKAPLVSEADRKSLQTIRDSWSKESLT